MNAEAIAGDADRVRALATALRQQSQNLDGQRDGLSGIAMDVWKGPAADAFRTSQGQLTPLLQTASQQYSAIASALDEYWPVLAEAKQKMRYAVLSIQNLEANADADRSMPNKAFADAINMRDIAAKRCSRRIAQVIDNRPKKNGFWQKVAPYVVPSLPRLHIKDIAEWAGVAGTVLTMAALICPALEPLAMAVNVATLAMHLYMLTNGTSGDRRSARENLSTDALNLLGIGAGRTAGELIKLKRAKDATKTVAELRDTPTSAEAMKSMHAVAGNGSALRGAAKRSSLIKTYGMVAEEDGMAGQHPLGQFFRSQKVIPSKEEAVASMREKANELRGIQKVGTSDVSKTATFSARVQLAGDGLHSAGEARHSMMETAHG